jgi:hypothetical protein
MLAAVAPVSTAIVTKLVTRLGPAVGGALSGSTETDLSQLGRTMGATASYSL